MKKVLIISALIAPNRSVGAIRPSKLAKYLTRKGYVVDIVAEQIIDNETEIREYDLSDVNKIYRLGRSFSQNNRVVQKQDKFIGKSKLYISACCIYKKLAKIENAVIKQFRYSYRTIKALGRYKKFETDYNIFLKSEEFIDQKYEVVISTFGPFASLKCGYKTKRKFAKIKWICDFRDPVAVKETSILFYGYFKLVEILAINLSDVCVTVSHGYKKRLSNFFVSKEINLVPNGYDVEDLDGLGSLKSSGYSFMYVGALYENQRDIRPLFKMIRELLDERVISGDAITFSYAGRDAKILLNQSREYNLEHLIVDFGEMSRKECLALQSKSRFLVLSSWNNYGEEGVFPAKFLEYMQLKKPVLSLMSGNKPNSEITMLIRSANLGIAYELSNHEADYLIMKNYLQEEYSRYMLGLGAYYEPDQNIVKNYDYREIINKFEELINND